MSVRMGNKRAEHHDGLKMAFGDGKVRRNRLPSRFNVAGDDDVSLHLQVLSNGSFEPILTLSPASRGSRDFRSDFSFSVEDNSVHHSRDWRLLSNFECLAFEFLHRSGPRDKGKMR